MYADHGRRRETRPSAINLSPEAGRGRSLGRSASSRQRAAIDSILILGKCPGQRVVVFTSSRRRFTFSRPGRRCNSGLKNPHDRSPLTLKRLLNDRSSAFFNNLKQFRREKQLSQILQLVYFCLCILLCSSWRSQQRCKRAELFPTKFHVRV